MKTIFRAMALALLMTAFSAATVTSSYAQDQTAEKQALYTKYTTNYAGTIEQKKIAIAAAEEYIQKWGASADDKEQVDYFQKALPTLKATVAKVDAAVEQNKLATRFDTAVKANNAADSFAAGKQILAQNPDFVDVYLVLASAGFDQAILATPVDTYNADAVNYAKTAIQKIEAGKPSTTGDWGAVIYAYRNEKFPDGKSNALGSMNYDIGHIMYFRQNQKKEAIPYFYKSLQYNSPAKNNPTVYQIIGASYFDEAKRLSQDSADKIKAANNTETDESKASYALAKGYADRAIDAYARAYKIASGNPASKKEYKDGLYKVIQDLYKFRYDGKIEGIDAYISTVMTKPMLDPAVAVTPVIEATPATTTNSSLSNSSNSAVDASAESSKNTATAKTTPAKSTAAVKTATPAKKPAPKKKGTR